MSEFDRLVPLHGYTLTGLRYGSHTLPFFLVPALGLREASLSSSTEPPAAEEEVADVVVEEEDEADGADAAGACVHSHDDEGRHSQLPIGL